MGSPWKEGEIRLEVDKLNYNTKSILKITKSRLDLKNSDCEILKVAYKPLCMVKDEKPLVIKLPDLCLFEIVSFF